MNYRHDDIKVAAPGTCSWVFQHSAYKQWRSNEGGMLCLVGNPGSGKSTLMKYVSSRASKGGWFSAKTLQLSFFFTARGHELQRSHSGLYRSVLCQLLRECPSLLAETTKPWQREGQSCGQALFALLLSSLCRVLEEYQVVLMVDALDECDGSQTLGCFKDLLSGCSQSRNTLRILFSCRPFPPIPYNGPKICIHDENKEDVKRYIRSELVGNERDLTMLHDTILACSEGNFQWAFCAIQQIIDLHMTGWPLAEIEKKISSLSRDLNGLYGDTIHRLSRATPKERSRSLQLFQWACFAQRPLSLQELRLAIAIGTNIQLDSLEQCEQSSGFDSDDEKLTRRIISLSGGLTEIKNHDGQQVVQFIHQTVKDYLLEAGLQKLIDGRSQALSKHDTGVVHYHLSSVCIRYLALIDDMPDYTGPDLPITQFVNWVLGRAYNRQSFLVEYAAQEWPNHACIADNKGTSLENLWDQLNWPVSAMVFHQMAVVRGRVDLCWQGATLQHLAATFRIDALFSETRMHRSSLGNLDAQNELGLTPLACAAGVGFTRAARWLLACGADPDPAVGWECSPFARAVTGGHKDIADLITEAKVELAVQSGIDHQTALQEVACWKKDMKRRVYLVEESYELAKNKVHVERLGLFKH